MAPTISQILGSSFAAIVAEKNKAANQWEESSFLRELERQGGIKRMSFGATIEAPIDYQRNAGAAILVTDLAATSLTKTDVLSAASYDIAEISVPMVWSKKDEVQNSSPSQKVDLVKSIAENGLKSHDDVLEQYLFPASTNGFLGLLTHISTNGQGSSGGISATTETMWRNQQSTYVDDTDIESTFTTVWNACAKGSGAMLSPTLIVSDGATQAIFEGTQQAQQRYVDSQELKAGFKVLGFKTSRYVFSPYGGSTAYFLNTDSFKLCVSKDYYKEKGQIDEIQNANGYVCKIYSAVQTVVNNRSRLGSAHV